MPDDRTARVIAARIEQRIEQAKPALRELTRELTLLGDSHDRHGLVDDAVQQAAWDAFRKLCDALTALIRLQGMVAPDDD